MEYLSYCYWNIISPVNLHSEKIYSERIYSGLLIRPISEIYRCPKND